MKAKQADPWASIDAIRSAAELAETPDVPGDAFTLNDYATRYRLNQNTAQGQLRKLVTAGKLKSGKQRRRGSDGRHALISVYWVAR